MTHADAIAIAARELDATITRYLSLLERLLRLDVAATGSEDQAALDRPPDPGSPWRRITVEVLLMREEATMMP